VRADSHTHRMARRRARSAARVCVGVRRRLFAWLQGSRRLITRFERKAENFLALLKLRCIVILARAGRIAGRGGAAQRRLPQLFRRLPTDVAEVVRLRIQHVDALVSTERRADSSAQRSHGGQSTESLRKPELRCAPAQGDPHPVFSTVTK
jgi:hypothetical protein